MLSKMQPSESMPMKNSFDGLKSLNTCAGSLIFFSGRKVGGRTARQSNLKNAGHAVPFHVAGNETGGLD
jgi:hypothetical protein